MLILPHADGLGLDLDELGQRILKPTRDRDSRAQIDVILREFLGAELARGIHRGARLGDDHIAQMRAALVFPADQLNGHLLGLAAGGAVADGDMLDAVAAHQGGERGDRLALLPLAIGRIDDGGVEHLARTVDDSDLAAHAVAGVEPHRDLALDRRLHQQRAQVGRKLADRAGAGHVGQIRADLALEGGEEQPVIGVLGRGADEGHRARAGHDDGAVDRLERAVALELDGDL